MQYITQSLTSWSPLVTYQALLWGSSTWKICWAFTIAMSHLSDSLQNRNGGQYYVFITCAKRLLQCNRIRVAFGRAFYTLHNPLFYKGIWLFLHLFYTYFLIGSFILIQCLREHLITTFDDTVPLLSVYRQHWNKKLLRAEIYSKSRSTNQSHFIISTSLNLLFFNSSFLLPFSNELLLQCSLILLSSRLFSMKILICED